MMPTIRTSVRPSSLTPLPVVRVADIRTQEQPQRWLVNQLWGVSSVGVIGGAPKCSKTWLALDLALSVATGTPCLGKYQVPEPGPVLVYLAEDALPTLRERVQGMDENHATEMAGLLAYFRHLQRDLDLSLVLVHHTRKNVAPGAAAGLGLRGSSDIHAFGDSNLYLRRTQDRLVLSSEHRAAAASPPVSLKLVDSDPQAIHLQIVAEPTLQPVVPLQQRVLELLDQGSELTREKLRHNLAVKNERLGEALEALQQAGQIQHTPTGWKRVPGPTLQISK